MVDHDALHAVLSEYASTLTRPYDVGEVLYRLTDHVLQVLPVDGAGVSIGDDDGCLQFVTATDEAVVRVEETQVRALEGPCQEAFRSGQRVTSADLAAEDRWPEYAPVAVEAGCRAVAGIPMGLADQPIGALNLYSRSPQQSLVEDLKVAQLLADMATGYVINARKLMEAAQLSAHLRHALESRVIIEQAKGVLAERHGIDSAEAFDRLRHHARNNRLQLHRVAGDIVVGTLTLDDEY